MTVSQIVARTFSKISQTSGSNSPSEKGFDEAIGNAMTKTKADREVCSSCGHAAHHKGITVASKNPALKAEKTSQSSESSAEIATQNEVPELGDQETAVSAAYRFSVFIRTSSDIGSYATGLAERFASATRNFVQALHQDSTAGINVFDSYLGQAQLASQSGEEKTRTFIDQMLEAADNGLKAVTASMNSAGMLSGLNLSMNSALPGTSAADIAGVYLQDAIKSGAINSNGVVSTRTSTSSLKLIRSEDLISPAPVLNTQQQSSPLIKNKILAKFMQMLDQVLFESGIAARPTEIEFSLEYGRLGSGTGKNEDAVELIEKMPEEGEEALEQLTT